MTKTDAILDRCIELYERDHGGCDDTTCGMHHALLAGYALVALEQWSSSGASDAEFNKLYAKLPKAMKFLGKEYNQEVVDFNQEVPTTQCGCGAYVYYPIEVDYHCSNCGKSCKKKGKNV